MDNDIVLMIFRLIHISTGVFWAGTVLFMYYFILPAANAVGADGGKFMQALTQTKRFPSTMTWIATINIISGLALFDHFSEHFSAVFFSTSHGIVMTLGTLSAIVGLSIGMSVNRPAAVKLGELGKAIAQGGGAPTPEQLSTIASLRNRLAMGVKYQAMLLLVAVVTMSVMRYF